MTLAEIAESSGIPERTIRYYIARGLLAGPVKGGRGAVYGDEHAARLARIRELQAAGRTLSEIERLLHAGPESEASVPAATPWWQHVVADDVTVWVKAGAGPWRLKQIHAALNEFARRVRPANVDEEPKTR